MSGADEQKKSALRGVLHTASIYLAMSIATQIGDSKSVCVNVA